MKRRARRGPDETGAQQHGKPAEALPVVGGPTPVRRSTRGRWRAAVLIAVHLVIVAHVTHFLLAGRTLSPVEPSESMYTLELGYVNAGILFFGVALLSTVIFGRFFCGWACHIVALQDLCGWAMKKLGVKPRPFRSRLLLLAPVAVAFYMFFWPTLLRLAYPFWPETALPALRDFVYPTPVAAFPGFSNHLLTDGFWDTFPGPLFAVLTFLTAGFAAVWFLGAKGFCTYGCPYGALFVATDKVAPARIRVTDACEQCGHCTAVCTSNVRVHEEVREFGMIVDPGCMKCMDCVSVCPNDALYYGWGRPALLKRRVPNAEPGTRRWPLRWGEELLIGAVALVATLAFRGLYDGPPLLMSVALGGITAYVALKLWHLARRATVRVQNLNLKLGGAWRPAGLAFAAVGLPWLVFTAHSGFVQWHRMLGGYWLERTEATREEVFAGAHRDRSYSPAHARAAGAAFDHFALAERFNLFGVPEVKLGLAWIHLLRGEEPAALVRLEESVALSPDNPALHDNLVQLHVARGRTDAAVEALRAKLAQVDEPAAADWFLLAELEERAGRPSRALASWLAGLELEDDARARFRAGTLLATSGRLDEAVRHFERAVALSPDSPEARYNLGGALRRLGRARDAVSHLEQARRLTPADVDTWVELGLAYAESGDTAAAAASLREAIRLGPERPESQRHLPALVAELETRRRANSMPD